jgi:hypothetical protein
MIADQCRRPRRLPHDEKGKGSKGDPEDPHHLKRSPPIGRCGDFRSGAIAEILAEIDGQRHHRKGPSALFCRKISGEERVSGRLKRGFSNAYADTRKRQHPGAGRKARQDGKAAPENAPRAQNANPRDAVGIARDGDRQQGIKQREGWTHQQAHKAV